MTELSTAVIELIEVYGAPSRAGFGSAVFCDRLEPTEDLAQAALAKYRYFAGDLWERYGEDAWMGPWREVYTRKAGAERDIAAELRAIDDADAALSAPMILDIDNGALAAAFDDPAVTELRVFNLGDGAAMSGLLIAGRSAPTHKATFLVLLMD